MGEQEEIKIISDSVSYTVVWRKMIFEIAIDGELRRATLFYQIEGEASQHHQQATVDGGTAKEIIRPCQGEIAPAAEISYFWRLTDTQGHHKRTEKKSFLYLDERFPWQSRTEGKVTLFWYEPEEGETLFRQVILSLAQIEERLGLVLREPIEVVVYASPSDMRPAVPDTWFVPGEVDVAGAAIWDHTCAFCIYQGWEKFLVHELTHLLTDQLVQRSDNDWRPYWLGEGLAHYAAMRQEPVRYHLSFRSSLLTHSPSWIEDIRRHLEAVVAQSESAITFLIEEQGGKKKIHQLLATLAGGTAIDDALLTIYGFDRQGLEEEWLDWLRATRRKKRKEKVLGLLRKLLPVFCL